VLTWKIVKDIHEQQLREIVRVVPAGCAPAEAPPSSPGRVGQTPIRVPGAEKPRQLAGCN
jgi:hypothetical protein